MSYRIAFIFLNIENMLELWNVIDLYCQDKLSLPSLKNITEILAYREKFERENPLLQREFFKKKYIGWVFI